MRRSLGVPRDHVAGGRCCGVAAALVAVSVVLTGAGWTYETLARRGDGQRHPAPGRLIDVGGHRLHLNCTGAAGGGPTVVFESGLDESSTTWATVQQGLTDTSATGRVRACGYDRAGYAWSEPGPGRRDAGRLAEELRTLLGAAGERGPFVLVGHSFGGQVVRLFADRWPAETAGLVLVDVTDERATGALRAPRRPRRPWTAPVWCSRRYVRRHGEPGRWS